MTAINVRLPEDLKAFLDQQIADGRFASHDAYLEALLRDAQQRTIDRDLEGLLIEGLDSGDPTPMTSDDWREIREEGLRRPAGNGPQ